MVVLFVIIFGKLSSPITDLRGPMEPYTSTSRGCLASLKTRKPYSGRGFIPELTALNRLPMWGQYLFQATFWERGIPPKNLQLPPNAAKLCALDLFFRKGIFKI